MQESSPVVTSFLGRWKGTPPAPPHELDVVLTAMHEHGKSAWPRVAVEAAAYAGFLGERAAVDAEAATALERLRGDDLYLACGCARGQADAIAAFDEQLLARVPVFVGTLRLSDSVLDEVRQLMRQKLFVNDGATPAKIVTYGGRGALDSWVRVAAMRTALNLIASEKNHASLDEERDGVSEMFAPGDDPELDYIKARHRASFARALRQSFQKLSQRDRNLLRFQFLDRLTPERIGSVYGVHRTTVMRWLADAQEQMLTHTRKLLGDELSVSPEECDSLFGLVRSRIDVTLRSLFRTEAP